MVFITEFAERIFGIIEIAAAKMAVEDNFHAGSMPMSVVFGGEMLIDGGSAKC
jgi:hypothetical protein